MMWRSILNIFCRSKARPWAKNLPQRTPTFSWQSGRKRLWQAALNDYYTILDICMISGAFGHTINRICLEFAEILNHHHESIKLKYQLDEQKIDFFGYNTL